MIDVDVARRRDRESDWFPCSPDEIDPRSLTDLLGPELLRGCRVRRTEVSTIGDGRGYLAQVARIGVDYDRPCHLPASFVAKFGATAGESRLAASRVGIYRREIGFYCELAPELPVSIPRVWGARSDRDFVDHVLLLDDVESVESDQVAGCSVDDASSVLQSVAELHAATWLDPNLLNRTWIPRLATAERIENLSDMARRGWGRLEEIGGDLIDERGTTLGAQLPERISTELRALDAMPWCLLHGDLRLDNVLLRPAGFDPVLIDWQGLTVGPAVLDVGYFLIQSLTIHDRRRHLEALLDTYYAALGRLGVDRPTEQTIRSGLRAASVFSLVVACSVPLLNGSGDPRATALARAMLERSLSAYSEVGLAAAGDRYL